MPEPLKPYNVFYQDKEGAELVFCCDAENVEHAAEQARNAEPTAHILRTEEARNVWLVVEHHDDGADPCEIVFTCERAALLEALHFCGDDMDEAMRFTTESLWDRLSWLVTKTDTHVVVYTHGLCEEVESEPADAVVFEVPGPAACPPETQH